MRTPSPIVLKADRYLTRQMSAQERAACDLEIGQNPALAAEVRFQQGVDLLVQFGRRQVLRNYLNEIAKEGNSPPIDVPAAPIKRIPVLWPALVAAAAVALIVLSYVLLMPDQPARDALHGPAMVQHLFEQYNRPYLSHSFRGRSESAGESNTDSTTDRVQDALRAYWQGDYAMAIEGFRQVPGQHEDRPLTLLLTGVSFLQLQQIDSAQVWLKQVQSPLFEAQSQWYLGLSYLAQEDIPQAQVHLQQAAQAPELGRKRQTADSLLRALDSLQVP